MSNFSLADVDQSKLTAQARWTWDNIALAMVEQDLDLHEIAEQLNLPRKEAGRLMDALREELAAQQQGPQLPELSQDDFDVLKDSIRAYGQQIPILLDQHGHVLDGNHRMRACRDLGIEPLTRTITVDDDQQGAAIGFVVNLARRQLTAKDKRSVVAAALFRDRDRADSAIAASLGVSHPFVGKVRKELEVRGSLETVSSRRGRDGRVIDTGSIGAAALPAGPPWDIDLAGDIAISIRCADGHLVAVHRKFKQIGGMRAAAIALIDELATATKQHYNPDPDPDAGETD
jgi:hypothetical protein